MPQRFFTVAAWAALCLVAYVTLSPLAQRPTLPTSWHIDHVAAFAVIGGLFCLAYPRSIFAVLVIVLGSAALLEFLQLLTPDRHARTLDAVQKIAGGGVGIIAGRAILHFDRGRSWFSN
jgi:VanZ family protein